MGLVPLELFEGEHQLQLFLASQSLVTLDEIFNF
jgi:hypothetical protein